MTLRLSVTPVIDAGKDGRRTPISSISAASRYSSASSHASAPDNLEFRGAIKLTADRAEKTRLCLRCHDEDNSPHFDFAKYWPKVEHNALDTPKKHLEDGAKPAAKK